MAVHGIFDSFVQNTLLFSFSCLLSPLSSIHNTGIQIREESKNLFWQRFLLQETKLILIIYTAPFFNGGESIDSCKLHCEN